MRDLRRGVGSVGSCWSHQGHRVDGSTLGSRKTRIYARKLPFYGTKDEEEQSSQKSMFWFPMLGRQSCNRALRQVRIIV